jgi:hypothetical protein
MRTLRILFGITYRWFPQGTPVSYTNKIKKKMLINLILGSSEGGFQLRYEKKAGRKKQ